ncbi:hypothetical protein GPALN_007955 [Globodera pallida]|uniref:Uncharacterized protein n=1 Tax=Globodera pallida TaxID=36090 RepID=A0A183CC07_GLOPA|nr:hypothetical protein GPALN_007955 [Globodera pallida]
MWGGYGGYYDGYNGYGSYGSQIILVVVLLIVGCLFLGCIGGGLWLLYSRQQKGRADVEQFQQQQQQQPQYYPQYYPRAGGAFATKEMSTEFR